MDRRKSRRRSLRILKCGNPVSESDKNSNSDVYGSVWLGEGDRQEPHNDTDDDKFPSDGKNESRRCQRSGSWSQSQEHQTDYHGGSEQRLHHDNREEGQIQVPCQDDSDKPQSPSQNHDDQLQSHVHTKSEKNQFALMVNGSSGNAQSHCHCENQRQSLTLGESNRVHSPDSSNTNSDDFTEKTQSPDFQGSRGRDLIRLPCEDGNDRAQAVQAVPQNVRNRNLTDCQSECVTCLSPCRNVSDQLHNPCHSEEMNHQQSFSDIRKDKTQAECHSNNDQFWSLCHNTPETVRSAQSVVLPSPHLSVSLREGTSDASVDVSCTSQPLHDSEKRQSSTLSTTPLWNDSQCEMDSETSLDRGFFHLEDSPQILENTTLSAEAKRLPTDLVVSPESVDLPACPTTLKVETVENTASCSNTLVSFTSETSDGASCSDSAFTVVPSVSISAERQVSEVIASPACSKTTTSVLPDKECYGEELSIASVDGINSDTDKEWLGANSADEAARVEQNSKILIDGTSATSSSPGLIHTGDLPEHDSTCTQPDFMVVNSSDQVATDDTSVVCVELEAQNIFSEGDTNHHLVSGETPGIGGGAVISKETEIIGNNADHHENIIAHTSKLTQDSCHGEHQNMEWTQHNLCLFQEKKQDDCETKSLKHKRKIRRRSAFGKELQLDMPIQQETVDAFVSGLQTEQYGSSYSVCSSDIELHKTQLLSGVVCESSVWLEGGQTTDRPEDINIEKSYQECGEPALSGGTKKKRRSTGSYVKAKRKSSSFQDTQVSTDENSDSLLFTKRRSSLRLYRQQSAAMATTIEKSGSDEMQLPAAAADGELVTQYQQEAVGHSEESEVDCDSVTLELEQLYKNKNYKRPADKTWETIFESPFKGRETSKQKLKRCIQFDYHVPPAKLKRRLKKAAQNGWNTKVKKSKTNEWDVLKKLEELDKELSQVDS